MHLKVKDDAFELLKRNLISNDASEIETLFVERISQLLKPCGIAAVILPSSILSNESGSYIGAREILLQNFYLRGIAQFGSKTFGATGTNTVVLFLEKYDDPPKKKEIIKDSVNAILSGKIEDDWNDKEIFKAYLEKINVEESLYKSFVAETISVDELKFNEYFAQYVEWFEKDKSQKKKSDQRNLLKVIKEKEWEKLFYFSLVYNQMTAVVSAPADNNEQKKFLGYDWSNRKGQEGIQIIQPGGMLYNDRNRYANDTLAAALQSSFNANNILLSENVEKYYSILRTQDMIDFSRVSFNKAIKLTADRKIEVTSKYPLVIFSSIISTLETGSRPTGGVDLIAEGVLSLGGEHIDNLTGYLNLSSPKYVPHDFYNSAIKGKLKKDDLLICKDGALTGKVALVRKELDGKEAMINEHIFIVRCKNITTQFYLFEFLYSEIGQKLLKVNITGSAQGGLSSSNLKNIKIPLPPLNIQQLIVAECEKIEEQFNHNKILIENIKKSIDLIHFNGTKTLLSNVCTEIFAGGDKPKEFSETKTEKYNIPVYANGVENDGLVGYTNFSKVTSNAVTISGRGTLGFSCIRTTPFVPIVRLVVALPDESKVDLRYFKYAVSRLNFQNTGGTIPQLTVPNFAKMHIPVPPLSEQRLIISKIEQYEEQIAQAKAIMAECPAKKKAILKKYLE